MSEKSWLAIVDHITFVVRAQNMKKYAWFFIEVFGGKLTFRCDDVVPDGKSSMMLWEIDFDNFAFALVAGISREERSHNDVFVDENGECMIQHIAFRPPDEDFEGLLARLKKYGLRLQGEPLARKEGDKFVKQAFTLPVYSMRNPAKSFFIELQARPSEDSPITFGLKTGRELYEQAQQMMKADKRAGIIDWSLMPDDWEPPKIE